MTHQPAISFSISLQNPLNRPGGRTFNVRQKMKIDFPCVTLNDCIASDGSLRCGIKIQLKDAEVNIWIKPEEMDLFSEVATASWDERATIQIGSCFDAPVFWCSGADTVSILIGHDAETWDVCFTLTYSVIREIQAELQTKKAESGRGDGIAPVTPPTPPGMRVRTGRFQ